MFINTLITSLVNREVDELVLSDTHRERKRMHSESEEPSNSEATMDAQCIVFQSHLGIEYSGMLLRYSQYRYTIL